MKIQGIGVDIVQNSRFNKKSIERFLTSIEIDIFKKIKTKEDKKNFLTGRWAAKEAIVKASNKTMNMFKISILKDNNDKPIIFYNGKRKNNIFLSISHEKEYTIAFAIFNK